MRYRPGALYRKCINFIHEHPILIIIIDTILSFTILLLYLAYTLDKYGSLHAIIKYKLIVTPLLRFVEWGILTFLLLYFKFSKIYQYTKIIDDIYEIKNPECREKIKGKIDICEKELYEVDPRHFNTVLLALDLVLILVIVIYVVIYKLLYFFPRWFENPSQYITLYDIPEVTKHSIAIQILTTIKHIIDYIVLLTLAEFLFYVIFPLAWLKIKTHDKILLNTFLIGTVVGDLGLIKLFKRLPIFVVVVFSTFLILVKDLELHKYIESGSSIFNVYLVINPITLAIGIIIIYLIIYKGYLRFFNEIEKYLSNMIHERYALYIRNNEIDYYKIIDDVADLLILRNVIKPEQIIEPSRLIEILFIYVTTLIGLNLLDVLSSFIQGV
ncbi:MAG: hypothetical protein B6U89_05615 [Desulfurococcales archaeon ex4484_58]|nr:MAG: hypothetical protein B6U89_05615 [Desulfurococcales archaeon ex4484_58]